MEWSEVFLTHEVPLLAEGLQSPQLFGGQVLLALLRVLLQPLLAAEEAVRRGVDDGELQQVQRGA